LQIHSLSEVLAESPVREVAPVMPPIPMSAPAKAAAAGQAKTAGMQAFDNARQGLASRRRKDAAVAVSQKTAPKIKLGARNYIAARHTVSG
jgi:hypothetical protein